MFIFIILLVSVPKISRANECGKIFDNFTSPFCTGSKYILLTGMAITAGLYFDKKKTGSEIDQKTLSKKPLQQFSKVGDIIGWGYLNGLYAMGSLFGGKDGRKNAEFMIEASAYTMVAVVIMKETISESRPGFPDEKDSFPSGHAALSFAFASVITANHAWYYGILAHGVAGFISYSRVQDERHYFHDIIAGATVGLSYAWGIFLNHRTYKKPYWFAMTPTEDLRGVALAFNYNL